MMEEPDAIPIRRGRIFCEADATNRRCRIMTTTTTVKYFSAPSMVNARPLDCAAPASIRLRLTPAYFRLRIFLFAAGQSLNFHE